MARFTINMISYTLKRTIDLTVIIPSATIPESMGMGGKPTHVIAEKYPVLYLLHGFGNNHTNWTSYANVELFAEERNMAVVMFSGENKSYINRSMDSFFDFIEEELPEFIVNMFPISAKPENTYIAGLSMAGYGSLVHGLSHPEKYAAIGSFSGAVSVVDMSENKEEGALSEYSAGLLDPKFLAKKINEDGRMFPKMYIACGEEDFLYKDNIAFKDQLIELGADVTWISLPGYTHEWRFWNLQVEKFLEWIPRTDVHVKNTPRKV